jgi:hypothetical protein
VILVGAGHVPSGIINLNSGFLCEAIIPPRASTMKETKKLKNEYQNLLRGLFSKHKNNLIFFRLGKTKPRQLEMTKREGGFS